TRTAYLQRSEFIDQYNRATHNNVFGLLIPQAVIPSISGPAQGTNSLNNVWGSAVGTLVSWEPVDFGLRKANVETAKAARDRAAAEVNVTNLQVATAAADAFLTIAATQQTAAAAQHPLAIAREAVVTEVKAREKALDHLYYPRLYLQGAAYARGTGIQPDGRTGGVASGLGPNIQNWALGATITFPAFDWFSIRARKEIEVHNERSAAANYDQTVQDLTGGIEKAKAVLEGARRVAQNTPIQLE